MTRFVPLVVWMALALLVGSSIDRVWIPHDEGLLAQSAERVLDGEVPHLHFTATYSGGLELLHAGAMRVMGRNLLSLRITLLVAYLVWLAIVYRLARSFSSPLVSAMVMLICGLSSVPQYPAALPSWYNLFLTTASVWALLSAFRLSSKWLAFAAGIAAGGGIGIKIVGLYTVAAGLLSVAWYCLEVDSTRVTESSSKVAALVGKTTFTVIVVAFVVSVYGLVEGRGQPSDILYFVLPPGVLSGLLIVRAWSVPDGHAAGLWRSMMGLGAPYVAGVAAIATLGLLAYWCVGGFQAAIQGILVLPLRRIAYASMPMPSLRASLPVTCALLAMAGLAAFGTRAQWSTLVAVLIGLVGMAVFQGKPEVADLVMLSARIWIPVVSLWFVGVYVAGGCRGMGGVAAWTLVAAAAMNGLIQYPFGEPVYFFYVAALAVMGCSALVVMKPGRRGPLIQGLAVLYSAWLLVNHVNVTEQSTARLDLARGGLRVLPRDAEQYRGLVQAVDTLTDNDFILALPDAPEVYFLTGKKNPTRSMFDFFETPDALLQQVQRALIDQRVDLVVIPNRSGFSGPLGADIEEILANEFPESIPLEGFTILRRRLLSTSSGAAPSLRTGRRSFPFPTAGR